MSNADQIAAALRPIAPGQKLATSDVPLINQIGALWDARASVMAPAPATPNADPAWVAAGRGKIGELSLIHI